MVSAQEKARERTVAGDRGGEIEEGRRRDERRAAIGELRSNYRAGLGQGWNTWDTNSVTTQVLLPEGLAIHVGLKHNATLGGDAFIGDALIGRLQPGAEQVVPGPHAWDGSYTDLSMSWKGHSWRIQSAHDGEGPGSARNVAAVEADLRYACDAGGLGRFSVEPAGHDIAPCGFY